MRARLLSKLLLAGSLVVCLIVRPDSALAVSRFPGNITDYFTPHLGYMPPCRLCHIDGTTGSGSVQTPFGISMLAHGLTGDRSTLTPALDALKAAAVDSDGDGVSDIDELVADTDPNTKADVPLSSSDPSYGCAVTPGHGADQRPGATLAAVALFSLVLLRRRSRYRH
jgi:MYXO-CTERM domain-containing protein